MLMRRLRCSFCGRSATEVEKLVAGPRVTICDRCAFEAVRIMNESQPGDRPSEPWHGGLFAALERRARALLRRLWRPNVPFTA